MNRTIAGAMIGLAAVITLISLAFILPAKHSGPHDLPIGLAGPATAISQIDDAITAQPADTFDTRDYESSDALRIAIAEREVVGGLAVGPDGLTVLVASAGGAQIAQAVTTAGTAIASETGMQFEIEDVVATTTDDPAAAGISGLALPIVFGGIIPAVVFARLLPGKPAGQGAAAAGLALLAGLILSLILRYGLGTFDGNVVTVALAIAWGMIAISLFIIGLCGNIGLAGIGVGAVLMMIIGNPLSGIATTAYWLPSGWSALGQLLPPGAAGTLLRSLAFFDGHGSTAAIVVLTCWTAIGIGLIALARLRTPAPAADTTEVLSSANG